jgi:hypothetical protein
LLFDPQVVPRRLRIAPHLIAAGRSPDRDSNRVNLDFRTPTGVGYMRAFLEADFAGSGNRCVSAVRTGTANLRPALVSRIRWARASPRLHRCHGGRVTVAG